MCNKEVLTFLATHHMGKRGAIECLYVYFFHNTSSIQLNVAAGNVKPYFLV